jgi:hypothetical protein
MRVLQHFCVVAIWHWQPGCAQRSSYIIPNFYDLVWAR